MTIPPLLWYAEAKMNNETVFEQLARALAELLPFAKQPDLIAHGSTPDRWHPSQFQVTREEAIAQAQTLLSQLL